MPENLGAEAIGKTPGRSEECPPPAAGTTNHQLAPAPYPSTNPISAPRCHPERSRGPCVSKPIDQRNRQTDRPPLSSRAKSRDLALFVMPDNRAAEVTGKTTGRGEQLRCAPAPGTTKLRPQSLCGFLVNLHSVALHAPCVNE